jgi:hypothetical protein
MQYDVCIDHGPDSDHFLVSLYGHLQFVRADTFDVSAPEVGSVLAEMRQLLPIRVLVATDGSLVDFERPLASKLESATDAFSDSQDDRLRDMMKSPQVVSLAKAQITGVWVAWVEAWRTLSLEPGQTQPVVMPSLVPGVESRGTLERRSDPSGVGLWHLTQTLTAESTGNQPSLCSGLLDLVSTIMRRNLPVSFDDCTVRLTFEAFTDPRTLMPQRVTTITDVTYMLRGILEHHIERHEYNFDWNPAVARADLTPPARQSEANVQPSTTPPAFEMTRRAGRLTGYLIVFGAVFWLAVSAVRSIVREGQRPQRLAKMALVGVGLALAALLAIMGFGDVSMRRAVGVGALVALPLAAASIVLAAKAMRARRTTGLRAHLPVLGLVLGSTLFLLMLPVPFVLLGDKRDMPLTFVHPDGAYRIQLPSHAWTRYANPGEADVVAFVASAPFSTMQARVMRVWREQTQTDFERISSAASEMFRATSDRKQEDATNRGGNRYRYASGVEDGAERIFVAYSVTFNASAKRVVEAVFEAKLGAKSERWKPEELKLFQDAAHSILSSVE